MLDKQTTAEPQTSYWRRVGFVVKAVEIRLRFIAVLVGIGLVIGYWDWISNHWDKWTRPAAGQVSALPADEEFYCPMHPNVVRNQPDPGGTTPKCPICGMPMSKRKKGLPTELPEGVVSRVQLSPYRMQLAGVQTTEVLRRPLTLDLRALGYVAIDESRLSRIVIRVSGYVEKLYVNKSFTEVRKGEPLAEIYSPELYSASQELLIARDGRDAQFVEVARKKLELLGIAESEIDEILRTGQAGFDLLIRSPQGGHIFQKNIVEGDRVEAGQMLFEVVDLSTIWVEGEVYEKDAAVIRPGQAVEVSVEGMPGRVFPGQVDLVHPHLETSTRTLRIRCAIDNPHHELLPGMFATLELKTPIAEIEPFRSQADAHQGVLAVPELSVIDTGDQKVVYVEREPGIFEGVRVNLGPRAEGYYAVIDGLQPGDRVATAGAFLVDAETRLNPAASAAFFGASGGPSTAGRSSPQQAEERQDGEVSSSSDTDAASDKVAANLRQLSDPDRELAEAQRTCPVTGLTLGSMGVPIKVTVGEKTFLVCCEGCPPKVEAEPEKYLQVLESLLASPSAHAQ